MSVVSDCITALKAIKPATFAIVEGAIELATLKERPLALPAAYVFVKQERAGPNERMTGPVFQPLEQDIAVIVITENLADISGHQLGDDLEVLKSRVRGALLGLVPASVAGSEPLEYVSGDVVKIGHGTVWHECVFGAASYVGEQLTSNEGDESDTF